MTNVLPELSLLVPHLSVDQAPSTSEFNSSIVTSLKCVMKVSECISIGEEGISHISLLLERKSSKEVEEEVCIGSLALGKRLSLNHLCSGEEMESGFERNPEPVLHGVGGERVGLGISEWCWF